MDFGLLKCQAHSNELKFRSKLVKMIENLMTSSNGAMN